MDGWIWDTEKLELNIFFKKSEFKIREILYNISSLLNVNKCWDDNKEIY